VGTLILFFVLAVILGMSLVLGVGPLAIIPAIAVLLVGVWMVVAFARGRSPGSAVRQVESPELLGPGGPDGPERAA